jgi:uncharacterized protein (TIGR02266 family)
VTTGSEHVGVDGRKHLRAPLTLEVRYRTTGSFLVSYSLNLSMGGLFLETDGLVPMGTVLRVRFSVPGVADAIEIDARVIWVREPANAEGLPAGLGLQFDALEDRIGDLIDVLVRDFGGVVVMAVAGEISSMERLSRYLRNIVACDVVDATPREIAELGFERVPDLMLIDLDSSGPGGLEVVRQAQQSRPAVPVVALASGRWIVDQAHDMKVAAVIDNPPAFEVLRRSVLDTLARPLSQRE